MNDYHRAKNVFGELTFGDYWNLVGCHAAAFRIKGNKTFGFRFGPTESSIKFYLGDVSFHPESYREVAQIRLDAKVKAFGNKVVAKNSFGHDLTIEFFELKPLDFDP